MRLSILASIFLLSGCASAQLNHNTLEIAETTDTLLTKQISYNLGAFIASPVATPSQVVVSAGTTSTTNTITPSVSFPVTNSFMLATAATATRTIGTAAAGGNLAGTNAASQNWGFTAVTDPVAFRRLQALYRYAVDHDASELILSYPLTQKLVSKSRPVCVTGSDGKCLTGKLGMVDVPLTSVNPSVNGGAPTSANASSNGQNSYSDTVPDEFYLSLPNCTVCLLPGRHYKRTFPHNLEVNPRLIGNWLRWRGQSSQDSKGYVPGDISIGRTDRYELFVDQHNPSAYTEFVAQILSASTQSGFSSSGNAASGTSPAKGGGESPGSNGGGRGQIELFAPASPQLTIPIQ